MTPKQKAFITEFMIDRNATQAALRAGYSPKSATIIGHENLRKPNIAKAIERTTRERIMTAEEAMTRLSDMARADMADFLHVNHGYITLDVERAIEEGKSHLIKKWKGATKTAGPEIELHDAKDALKVILQIYDKMQSDDWRGEIIEYLKSGQLTPQEVADELGHELASELFTSAGVVGWQDIKVTPQSDGTQDKTASS